jgi:hypothetical protein
MTEIQKTETPEVSPNRARRILAALVGGMSLETISDEENLPSNRVESIVQRELSRRWIAPVAEFAKIQIARLENLCLQLTDRVENGELAAFALALKIIDRLDRYHGFNRANPPVEPYSDEHRERLLAKLNAAAANLAESEGRRDA